MSSRFFIWLGVFVGSTAFGCIPMLWGDDLISAAGMGLSFVGAIVGLFGGWKLTQMIGGG